jgi:hypothetical protein
MVNEFKEHIRTDLQEDIADTLYPQMGGDL